MNQHTPLKNLQSQFPPFGECMYCGSKENLSREHIVPYGLNGPGVIPKSSCGSCSEITSKFERHVLRGPLWGLRAYLRFSSRRKQKLPKNLPFILKSKGTEFEVSLPIDEHPIMLTFPVFGVPTLAGGKKVIGINIKGSAMYNFGAPVKEVLDKYNADDFRVTETSQPVSFARLLAKIAWGVAVINGQHAKLDSGLLDAFLYNPNDIGQWVGTYTDPLVKVESNLLHEIRIREDNEIGFLMADVKLFSNSETPRYGVILGRL